MKIAMIGVVLIYFSTDKRLSVLLIFFVDALREYLRNSKPEFAESIRSTLKLDDSAEELLKKAIAEFCLGGWYEIAILDCSVS